MTTACLTSYTASVLALIGSAIIVGHIPGLGLKAKVPTTECQNWNHTSPCTFTDNIIINNQIQDCFVSPDLLDRLNDTDVNIPDLNNNNNDADCSNWNPFSLLYLSPIKIEDVSRVLAENLKGNNDIKLFGTHGNAWKWTDAIKNYLLKDSVPTILFPIASF